MGYQPSHGDLRDMEARIMRRVRQEGENMILLRQHVDEQVALLREDIDAVSGNPTQADIDDVKSELTDRLDDLRRDIDALDERME